MRRGSTLLLTSALLVWCALLVAQASYGPRDGAVAEFERQSDSLTGIGALVRPDFLSGPSAGWLALLLAAGPGMLLLAQRNRTGKRRILFVFLGLLASLTFLELPQLSNDLFLYRATGEMYAEGVNPYLTPPAGHFKEAQLQGVPWTGQSSAYGPLAIQAFSLATRAGGSWMGSYWILRTLMALPWLILVACLWRGNDTGKLWMIGASPLLLLEVVQSGHLDGWMGLCLVGACALAAHPDPAWPRRGALALLVAAALSLKLTAIVTVGALLVHLLRHPAWSGRAVLGLGALVILLCSAAWAPVWTGPEVLDGLRAESGKVLQSLFQVARVPAQIAGVLAGIGSLLALVLGGWLRVRGWSLCAAMIAALLVQALIGRTFLQAWYFVPPLMLAVCAPARGPRHESSLVHPAFWGVASVGLIFGAYGPVFLTRSLAPAVQTLSVTLMLLPGALAAWIIARRPG